MKNRQAMVLPALVAIMLAAPAAAQDDSGGVMQDNVIVLLDASGSMKEKMKRTSRTKMDLAKEAIVETLATVPGSTNVGILVFSGRNVPDEWIYPLGPIDRAVMTSAVQRPEPKGNTPLGRYMKIASDRLLLQRDAQYGYGSYRLLVVTDGQAGDQELVDRFLPDIVSRGITVDVIGVDMQSTHALATQVHSYRRADDPEALLRAVSEVFAEVGQSTDDATDEDEFELIAGIPDAMAASLLQALARSGNHPIGTTPARPSGKTPAAAPATPADRGRAAPTGSVPSTPSSKGLPPIVKGFIFFIVVIIVVRIIVRKVSRGGGGY